MKYKKKLAKLANRIKAWESLRDQKGYQKPGSEKK